MRNNILPIQHIIHKSFIAFCFSCNKLNFSSEGQLSFKKETNSDFIQEIRTFQID